MDGKSLTGTVVGLAVVIILAATLLMPALNDATQTHETFTNDGLYYMTYVPEGDSHTLVYTASTSSWTFDGEAFDDVGTGQTILGTDDLVVRGEGRTRGIYSVSGTVDISLTVTNTTLTGYIGSNTLDLTYDKIILATPDASDLVMKASTTEAYVLNDDTIEAYGITYITVGDSLYNYMVIHLEGTIADGFTITAVPTGSNTYDYSIDNIETDAVAVDGYNDLYTITTITFDVVIGDYTTACTYNVFIVPTTTTAELSQHLDSGQIALVDVIPIIIIVSIVLAAVGVVVNGRRD